MLIKNYHKTRQTRHRVTISYLQAPRAIPLIYRLKNSAGRSDKGRITAKHRCRPRIRQQIPLTKLPSALLPGTIMRFIYIPNYPHLRAYIKTNTGAYIILPAVRDMAVGDSINVQSTNGSFVSPDRIPPNSTFCNIITHNARLPQFLRAPGTYAKNLVKKTALLPRNRTIFPVHAQYVQIGINAHHDWKHTNIGHAGHARKLGHRPIVRNKAKNPNARVKPANKFKSTRRILPWAVRPKN